jgi:hypothetical protein
MFCIHCGAPNPEDASFCNKCGKAVAGIANPAIPAEAPRQVPASTMVWSCQVSGDSLSCVDAAGAGHVYTRVQ